VVEIKAYKPGPFEIRTEIFLDDNGLRAVEVIIRGTGIAAPPKP
jgi:hypothetical protein